ncbi:Acetyl-CoA synthetase [Spironucleus salmonicida]|uniref:Acetyl-CoA synthetase n=1 Tax=Spironucleus salmonicida TaxID=348837 RepID=K7RUK4_9EUKA|nr:acetyl-CoA synthetase [Spironucleus salmonicida]KAH0570541.1 Acetyl-CoA synthetase [Spironucleus salmonicida]|eukprot:EST49290.1 Acetyl-CoA synthetase [Spironucleus salmonicida]
MYSNVQIQFKQKIAKEVAKNLEQAIISTPFQHIAQIKYDKLGNFPYIKISDYSLEETSVPIPYQQSHFTDLLRSLPEFISSIYFDNYRNDISVEFQTQSIQKLQKLQKISPDFFDNLFQSKPTIAVIGASSQKFNIGNKLIGKLQQQRVPVFAISDKQILGVDTYSLTSAPIPDIVLITTPAKSVQNLLNRFENIPKIVFSAGFEDFGGEKLTGQNFIGPNSVGFISAIDMTFFNEIFNKTKTFGVISDSGAVLGKLAKNGGCGVSSGNGNCLDGSEFVVPLGKRFDKIALYLEKDNIELLKEIIIHQNIQFYGFFGGVSNNGKARALQHSGQSISDEYIKLLQSQPNFHQFSSLNSLNFAVSSPQIHNLITISQSGYVATKLADLVQVGSFTQQETQYIQQQFDKFRVPAKVNPLLDCTPQLPAIQLAYITDFLSQNKKNFVALSLLPSLMDQEQKLELLQKLSEIVCKNMISISVENDLEFGGQLQKMGFEIFDNAENMGAIIGEKQKVTTAQY